MSNRAMFDHREPMMVSVKRDGNILTIQRCPYCYRGHSHGAGGQRGPFYGHRLAHCVMPREDNSAGYYLAEVARSPATDQAPRRARDCWGA